MQINTNFNYSEDEYYLCYMDEYNFLNIVEDIHLKISSFESNIRRFYLLGNFTNKLIHSEVLLKGSNKYGYEAKICVNKQNPSYSDFINSSESIAIVNDIDPIYEDVIPIDILLTSYNSIESNVNLCINVDIVEHTPNKPFLISCDGATSRLYINKNLQYHYNGGEGEEHIHWRVKVDDVLYPDDIYLFNDLSNFFYKYRDDLGIVFRYGIKPNQEYSDFSIIETVTDTPRRVKLIPSIPYINRMTFENNPTVSIQRGTISFCLNAENPLLCTDATNKIKFSSISKYGWSYYVNDILLDLSNIDQLEYDLMVYGNYEFTYDYVAGNYEKYRCSITNLSLYACNIKLVPKSGYSPTYTLDTSVINPSFTEHSDGSISWCLKGHNPQ